MVLQLKNTLTGTLEPFRPLDPAGRRVSVYSCGPTVYSFAHIGNFRSFLLADVLRRVLARRGYEVHHVMNITDVGHLTQDHIADASGEDKLAKAARELGTDPLVVAQHFEAAFAADAKALGLANYTGAEASDRSLHPQATHYIPEMLALIQRLLEKECAYTDGAGQVYFDISKFPEYGQLSGKKLDELDAGARVDVREEKRDPRDFALWKVDPKHLMQWDPHTGEGFDAVDCRRFAELLPDGIDPRVKRGFPGWHIECSAMANATLGALIDIHTGGEDNVFPHHECEIAQTCAALDASIPDLAAQGIRSFARYWLHARHLLVDNHKMSKRDGTFFTVRDLMNPLESHREALIPELQNAGFADGRVPAVVLRYALMATSYLVPMNFTFEVLTQARSNVGRLQTRYERLLEIKNGDAQPGTTPASEVAALIERARVQFDEALDNNLDVSGAMAAAGSFVGELNLVQPNLEAAELALGFLNEVDAVLGVLVRDVRSGILEKTTLDQWANVEFRKARAALWSDWASDAVTRPLHQALSRGELPDGAALTALPSLDQHSVELLLAARQVAKKEKQFQLADQLRARLQELRVVVEDTATGVRWKLP